MQQGEGMLGAEDLFWDFTASEQIYYLWKDLALAKDILASKRTLFNDVALAKDKGMFT